MRTRAPVVSGVQALPVTPRLACVRPAASVHPEPGSNSSSLILIYVKHQRTIEVLPAPSLDSKFLFIRCTVRCTEYAVFTIFQWTPKNTGNKTIPVQKPQDHSPKAGANIRWFFKLKILLWTFLIFFLPNFVKPLFYSTLRSNKLEKRILNLDYFLDLNKKYHCKFFVLAIEMTTPEV